MPGAWDRAADVFRVRRGRRPAAELARCVSGDEEADDEDAPCGSAVGEPRRRRGVSIQRRGAAGISAQVEQRAIPMVRGHRASAIRRRASAGGAGGHHSRHHRAARFGGAVAAIRGVAAHYHGEYCGYLDVGGHGPAGAVHQQKCRRPDHRADHRARDRRAAAGGGPRRRCWTSCGIFWRRARRRPTNSNRATPIRCGTSRIGRCWCATMASARAFRLPRATSPSASIWSRRFSMCPGGSAEHRPRPARWAGPGTDRRCTDAAGPGEASPRAGSRSDRFGQ